MQKSAPSITRNKLTGAVVAFVGPDASGKTTLSNALSAALRKRGMLTYVTHMGSPPRTWISKTLRVLIKGLWKIFRLYRREGSIDDVKDRYPRFQSILDVLIAFDRKVLVRKSFKLARSGYVVITDRYPGQTAGSASGPAIQRSDLLWLRLMSNIEQQIYLAIPHPQLVIRIQVPLEETIRRNSTRPIPKPEAVITESHISSGKLKYGKVPELLIDNTPSADNVLKQLSSEVIRFLIKHKHWE